MVAINKKLFILAGLFIASPTFAANRYFVSGGVNNLWSTTGNWSLTDGGAGGQTVPSNSDAVYFTANSPNCTVDGSTSSARTALLILATGYTNRITMINQITVSGGLTLGSGMTIDGTNYFRCIVSTTHTFNGITVPSLWFSGAVTHTLADAVRVTNLRGSITTQNTIVNGSSITIASGLFDRGQATSGDFSGTSLIYITGNSTIVFPTTTGTTQSSITFDSTGTITFPSGGTFVYNGGTLTYLSGIIANSSTCDLTCAAATTFNLGPNLPFRDCTVTGAVTNTFTNDFYCRDFINNANSVSSLVYNGSNIYISRNLTYGAMTTGTTSGTTVFNMVGTGNITTDAMTTGRLLSPLTINTSGTITIVSAVSVCNISFFNFKYVNGTVIAASTWGNNARSNTIIGSTLIGTVLNQ